MASLHSPSARFRSATEFPKSVETLPREQADQLYEELRECLVFTNRSRAQLTRWNDKYRQSTLSLKTDVERMQRLIQQLTLEKQQVAQEKQQVVAQLEQEMGAMVAHLDELAIAFDGIADAETAPQTQWAILAFPARFFRFLESVRAVVTWWRGGHPPADSSMALPGAPDPTPVDGEEDRRENPQMYTDPASQGRSLLDR